MIRALVALLAAALLLACAPAAAPPQPAVPAASNAAAAHSPAPSGPPAASAPPAAPAPAPPVPVRVNHLRGVSPSFDLAVARGYFREQGLEIEIPGSAVGPAQIQLLSTGEADVGVALSASPAFFNAAARGIDLKLVIDNARFDPQFFGSGFIVRQDLWDSGQVRTPQDLRGRKIASQTVPGIGQVMAERMLAQGGLTLDDVEMPVLSFPDQLVAFGGGSIDLGFSTEPFITLARMRGLAVPFKNSGELSPGHQFAAIGFAGQFASGKPEAARRFAVGFLRGLRDFNDAYWQGRDREAVARLLGEAAGLDPEVAQQVQPPPTDPNGYINVESLRVELDFYFERGIVPVRPDLAQLVDRQFVEYAVQQLGAR